MVIVEEEPAHQDAIRRVVAHAFGRDGEARLVDDLRRDGDLVLSLVALEEGEVCGHLALSHLKSPPRALALAPVSVLTARQRQGIGSALVRSANERAGALGYDIVFVLGHPAYYPRFGFSVEEAARFPCRYAGPHFMALNLTARRLPPAPVIYADAFANPG
jgi:putative acetyltransferase